MKIAVLYTCFNRKQKTLSSLEGLFTALKIYNQYANDKVVVTIYLTDDGCTDGTSKAILDTYPDADINILNGNGDLFWAGGMRLAWKAALRNIDEFDFYLLLNDDTDIFGYCIKELIDTHEYCLTKYGKDGIYSGITCDKEDMNQTTYGGRIITNSFLGSAYKVSASGIPQLVHQTNANILLVPKSVVDKIGIFYEGFRHGNADYDYSMHARRKGIPVLVTAHYCGACNFDHPSGTELKNKILSMSKAERTSYFSNPLHSSKDYLIFIRRNIPLKYPITWIFRMLQEKFPKVYYFINRR